MVEWLRDLAAQPLRPTRHNHMISYHLWRETGFPLADLETIVLANENAYATAKVQYHTLPLFPS